MGAGHAHTHDHGGWWNYPLDKVGRRMGAVMVAAFLCTLIGMFALWPDGDAAPPMGFDPNVEYTAATVTDLGVAPCFGFEADSGIICEIVGFDINDGPRAGNRWETEFSLANTVTPDFTIGDDVVLVRQPDVPDERFEFYFIDFERKSRLWVLVALFAVAIIALGGLVGVRALVSLVGSLGILIVFTLPSILEGHNPVVVALVGSSAVAIIALYLTHGFNHLTTVALLGSFASLAITGLLAWFFIEFTALTGLQDENAASFQVGANAVNLKGLLLAGVVIGTLGVLDDVTVTQASAVSEIHNANPEHGFGRVYSSALKIGRAHIASTVNTLVLAYAGASLPLLLLFTQAQQPLGQILNAEVVSVEIVRTLVGSIGLVAAIPVTTALAAFVVCNEHAEADHPDHDHEHSHDEPTWREDMR